MNLFVKWLKHFIAIVKPNVDEKVLLVLDGKRSRSHNATIAWPYNPSGSAAC